jgi:menaquinone-9 beta-reductase
MLVNRAGSWKLIGEDMGDRILIVGAGPGGCATAIALARRGFQNVTLVDRARFPREKTCGSAISPLGLRVLAELGVADEVRRRAYTIHSLLLTTPGGRRLRLRGGEAALVLLRKDFDQLLVDRARTLGVQFRDDTQVTGLFRDRGRVAGVRSGADVMTADYVICADGAHSRLSQDARPRRALATIMGWWEPFEFEPGTIEMVFDRTLSPLYGWMFPETPSRVNIGIVVDGDRAGAGGDLGNLRPVFEDFLQRHYGDRLRHARGVGRWSGHPIAHAVWPRAVAAPGVLFVGESARLTNAATGEGIYQAMRCGVLAAETVDHVVHAGVAESNAWRQYSRRCRSAFVPGFVMGHTFRGAVRLGMLDAIGRVYERPRLRRLATWAIGSALTTSSVSGEAPIVGGGGDK